MAILAGDIGGTKTRLALYEPFDPDLRGEGVRPLAETSYPSTAYRGLESILREFLEAAGSTCESACLGIAGPVRGNRVEATNLPWTVEAEQLRGVLRTARVRLMNDLEATAHGIAMLGEDDLLTLNPGRGEASGNQALIAAGTGLGEAGLWWDGARHHPFATEGGHASFSPSSEQEIDLLRFLSRRYGHVSWERLVSGPGLVEIYRFLIASRRAEEPEWLVDQMRAGDASAAISAAALSGRSELAAEALDLFVRLYGREAGNLALKVLGLGGVFVGGGIAPKIRNALRGPTFLQSFRDKGRMGPMLESIPIRLVLNDRTALLGAAACAMSD